MISDKQQQERRERLDRRRQRKGTGKTHEPTSRRHARSRAARRSNAKEVAKKLGQRFAPFWRLGQMR